VLVLMLMLAGLNCFCFVHRVLLLRSARSC